MSVSGGSLMVWGLFFFFSHGRSPLVVVQGVEVLDWPSRSPDLNPIEHIWDELGRRVRQQVNTPQTLGDLERAIVEQWRRLPQTVFTNVLRHCVAVRDARGGHIRININMDFWLCGTGRLPNNSTVLRPWARGLLKNLPAFSLFSLFLNQRQKSTLELLI